MNKKSIVLLLSLALLMVSGSLYAAAGQRGPRVADETEDAQWTPRWMNEEISTDQTWGPRGFASDQGPSEGTSFTRNGRGAAFDSRTPRNGAQLSAGLPDDTRRGFGSDQMMSRRGPSPQGGASNYGDRDSRQRQLRTPADDCCYLENGGRQYLNQDDELSFSRNGASNRRSMMR